MRHMAKAAQTSFPQCHKVLTYCFLCAFDMCNCVCECVRVCASMSVNAFSAALFRHSFRQSVSQFVNPASHSVRKSFVRSHKCIFPREGKRKKEEQRTRRKRGERRGVSGLDSPQQHFVNTQWASDLTYDNRIFAIPFGQVQWTEPLVE